MIKIYILKEQAIIKNRIEKDKPTAEGKMKDWHTIEIIERKYRQNKNA